MKKFRFGWLLKCFVFEFQCSNTNRSFGLEYMLYAVLKRTIIKKSTGNVTVMSFSKCEDLSEKTITNDNYIQIIEGVAEITNGKNIYTQKLGSVIVIPVHALNHFNVSNKFKMISTIIKSGY